MKRNRWMGIAAAALALALPLAAQQPKAAPEAKEGKRKTVIVRDGERVELFDDDGTPGRVFVAGGGGYLGISPIGLTDELRTHFGVPKDAGVMVGKVFDDTPAAKSGLRVGDIITQIDGKEVESAFDVTRAMRGKKKGDQVRVDYIRDRAAGHAFVTLDERRGGSAFTFTMPEIPPIEIDEQQLEKAMEGFRAFRVAPEARAKILAAPDCDELQSRLKDLESRLKELEKRLK
ncbi:MAG TPA: PDZ domain-containing protein [Thermoanaerobaculia bacterium]